MKTFLCVLLLGLTTTLSAQATATATTPEAKQDAKGPQENAAKQSPKSAEDSQVIPKGAKLYIASMPDDFNEYVKAAIQKKAVPVTVVDNRDQADFEMTGFSETQKAGTAKKLITGSWHSRESASIKVANIKTSTVAFAYSYNNDNSMHGKKTSAEACAKHLKDKIESGK